MALMRANPKLVDARFLLYAFLAPQFQNLLRARTISGSTVDRIPLIEFPEFPITVPEMDEQRAIASVLTALDDKIELNRQMNKTLEDIARAIFRSWFVDFDPVRTKGSGAHSRIPIEVAAQFPSQLCSSTISLIPDGWEIGSLISRARLLSGGTPKTDRLGYWNGDVLWCSAKDVSQATETMLLSTERTITAQGLAESATQLIPALCTVVVARGATTGRMVLLGQEMAINQTCYALQSSIGAHLFLYCQLREEMSNLVHAAHGSIFDTITTTTFTNSLVVVPPEPLVLAFESHVRPLFDRILSNTKESRTLATLRKELLPKLISGDISLLQAGKMVEANA